MSRLEEVGRVFDHPDVKKAWGIEIEGIKLPDMKLWGYTVGGTDAEGRFWWLTVERYAGTERIPVPKVSKPSPRNGATCCDH